MRNCVLRTVYKARRIFEVLQIWEKIGQHSFDSFFFGLAGDDYLKPSGVMQYTLLSAWFKWSVN